MAERRLGWLPARGWHQDFCRQDPSWQVSFLRLVRSSSSPSEAGHATRPQGHSLTHQRSSARAGRGVEWW